MDSNGRGGWAAWWLVAALASACGSTTDQGIATGTAQAADTNSGDGTITTGDGTGGTGVDAGAPAAPDSGPDGLTDAAIKYPLCSEVLACLGLACAGSSDPNCGKPCLDGTPPANQQAIAPYLACVDQSCRKGLCAGSVDASCVGQCAAAKCFAKSLACGANAKTGSEGCVSLLGCFGACEDGGPACWYDCYAKGDASAQLQFDQLMACASAAGGPDPFAACPAQLLGCAANGKQGDGTCAALWTCTSTCDQLPEAQRLGCYGQCWGNASAAARQGWLAMAGCFGQPKAGCGATIAACAAPTGSASCLATSTCIGACDKAEPKEPGCFVQCLQKASPAEAAKTAELVSCVGAQCGQCKGQNPCQEQCMQQQCGGALQSCLAP